MSTAMQKFATVAAAPALAAAGLALLVPSTAQAEDTTTVNDSVKSSVVQIYAEWTGYLQVPPTADDPQGMWLGPTTVNSSCSGFFVDQTGFIATAGHCVDPDGSDVKEAIRAQSLADLAASGGLSDSELETATEVANAQQWTVEGKDNGAPIERHIEVVQAPNTDGTVVDSWTTAQVVTFQKFEDGDNALLKLSGVPETTPLVVSALAPKDGQDLTAVGFPANIARATDMTRVQQPSFKSGTASSQQVSESGVAGTEINADLSGGMSGGPTVDAETGEVLGVNSYLLTQGSQQNFNFITNAPALRSFLASNGVQLAEAPAPESGTPVWIWGAIGGAAAVLLAAITAVILRVRRKADPAPPSHAPIGFGPPVGSGPQQPTGAAPYGYQPQPQPQWVAQYGGQPVGYAPPGPGNAPSTPVGR
ncbi:serine protease [Aldersonia sp. NBC_00410]|uniref:S1 family peptidase n=1 Tax=Aldersonia sp. NBC_00410 TaxID=2975954 RepID=UPI002250BFE7|nr:serine protease [Aldersonia sp. NBC_00410]MCX5041915.1 serine protease [Aldersonia sp. NBC_00410]